jgi:hypothetical protein
VWVAIASSGGAQIVPAEAARLDEFRRVAMKDIVIDTISTDLQ